MLTSPVYSGIVIAFCALLVANQWGPAGDEGSIVNVATLMLVVVAVYVVVRFLPALRASAPQCLIWGMPIASLLTCIYDASQPESNTTAAHGLAQFANAPVLSMAGQVMLGVLLGTQPLPVRSRFVGVVLSIALWELNLLLVSQRTGNIAYLTALLPQTAAPLFSGHVIGVLTARVLVQRKVAGATTLARRAPPKPRRSSTRNGRTRSGKSDLVLPLTGSCKITDLKLHACVDLVEAAVVAALCAGVPNDHPGAACAAFCLDAHNRLTIVYSVYSRRLGGEKRRPAT